MKLIEKLAKEQGEYLADAYEARLLPDAIEGTGDLKPEYRNLLALFAADIYEAGFRKAREMAWQALQQPTTNLGEYIRTLGESEVES